MSSQNLVVMTLVGIEPVSGACGTKSYTTVPEGSSKVGECCVHYGVSSIVAQYVDSHERQSS